MRGDLDPIVHVMVGEELLNLADDGMSLAFSFRPVWIPVPRGVALPGMLLCLNLLEENVLDFAGFETYNARSRSLISSSSPLRKPFGDTTSMLPTGQGPTWWFTYIAYKNTEPDNTTT